MGHFITVLFAYILPIVCTLGLLLFWRHCTVSSYSFLESGFPSRIHVLVIFIATLIPFLGALVFTFLVVMYIFKRMDGDIEIKETKFSKFWFDKNNFQKN